MESSLNIANEYLPAVQEQEAQEKRRKELAAKKAAQASPTPAPTKTPRLILRTSNSAASKTLNPAFSSPTPGSSKAKRRNCDDGDEDNGKSTPALLA